ncbi:MAG TPA: thiamine pyrophosphate-dependent enzyme [Patescibacteria group bacterium]|jgi:acetolactate synthase I/II/III large subunit|nr:thiamine pyrophosphate-dependent enzyme [Patescibacteria group bacterium]
MKIKAANGLARILKTEGIPWVSCYPTNHVNNALGEEGVPILMMGEERFAVAVADGFSRVTSGKQIGVCTVMANLNAAGIQMAYGAIAQAWEDSSPLLVIAEGVGQGGSRHTHYDMVEAFKSVTKWVGKVDRADLIPDYVRRAFTQLRSGRPGPVLLVVPRDLGEYDTDEHPYAPVKGWRTGPDPDDVKAAVKMLLAAKDPLLYVGEGVYYADATSELLQFAEAAQVPVLTTLKGKGTFPENHPLSVGVRGSLAEHFLRKADVLFSIGSSLFPNRFSHAIPDADRKSIVQCTVDTLDINRSYETAHAVIGDAKLTLQALSEELSKRGGVARKPALLEEIRTAKQAFMAKFRPWMESSETPINPYRVLGDLIKVLDPKNSFVTADSGNTRDQTSTVYEAHIPRGHLGWGNVSTLGFSLAGAVAAKLAYPNRQSVLVTGDAGVCYMMGNFEAVARYKIGVTVLHINNGGYSGYGPGFWGGGHDPYTWKVSDHASACMANMAKAVGFHAEDVSAPGEIIPALKRALDENAKGRPAFLEFMASHHPVHGGWVRPA